MSPRLRDILVLIVIGLAAYLPGIAALPVIDRDEARYAQSVVQMVETGDYIDIRFQDEPRYKKPVGAYWAQVAALAATGQLDDVRRGERPIWAQRLPSVAGALLAVIFTYLAGLHLFARREAFLGAALLAVSISLVFEAHQAKTDALLAAASACVLYALVARKPWPLWLGLGAAILVKGPVLPVIVVITVLSLIAAKHVLSLDRNGAEHTEVAGLGPEASPSLRTLLRPLPILVALALVLPWFIAIGILSDGAFYAQSLGADFGAKLGSAQETHGGPPGYYALTTLVMFWPATLVLPLAVAHAWRNRTAAAVLFLLAWIVPNWLVLELVPTKLPHYTLPLYPALALICGAALASAFRSRWLAALGAALFTLPFIAFGALALMLGGVGSTLKPQALQNSGGNILDKLSLGPSSVALAVIVFGLPAGWIATRTLRKRTATPLIMSAVFASVTVLLAGSLLIGDIVYTAKAIVQATPTGARIVSPDFREPSLVYLGGTDTRFDLSTLAPGDQVFVRNAYDRPENIWPPCAGYQDFVLGYNYAKGERVYLSVIATADCAAEALAPLRAMPADP